MLVLLNGGRARQLTRARARVPLADACVTEWRLREVLLLFSRDRVPLADACVTEWRLTC